MNDSRPCSNATTGETVKDIIEEECCLSENNKFHMVVDATKAQPNL